MSIKTLGAALLTALALTLAGCGGSSSSTATSTDCSSPRASDSDACAYVSFTDAPGDFLTYTVKVTGLSLKRSDGTVVDVLPASTSVDFAQYDGLSEFLTLATIPPGTYTSGSVTLDYSGADIEVQDNNGNAVKVAPVDENGDPVTTLTLNVQLDSTGALVLVPGVPKVFQLDFNLTASNTVDLTDDTVTVAPFLVASVDPNLNDQLRVRGPLNEVDTADSSFSLGLRPFYAASGDYGNMGILTTSTTIFHVDHTGYTGSAGLAALAADGATTAVVAKGSFDFGTHRFVATEVDAGSSVPGGTLDAAQGVVLSRNGNTLMLKGATLYRTGHTASFADSVKITLGTNTKVRKETTVGVVPNTDISVGQRLTVFGTLTNTSPSALALDASSGYALMEYSSFDGLVTIAPSGGQMTVNVEYIDGRPIGLFDFTGTGSDPANYVVSIPAGTSGVAVNDPVRVWGFVSPFGSTPPDFTGSSVADYAHADTNLVEAWAKPGSADAFTSMSATSGIVLNTASTPTPFIATLAQGGIPTPISSLITAPTVKGSVGFFAIAQDGVIQVHLTLSGFLSDLNTRLNSGAKVRLFFARGGFDATTDTLSAADIGVIVK